MPMCAYTVASSMTASHNLISLGCTADLLRSWCGLICVLWLSGWIYTSATMSVPSQPQTSHPGPFTMRITTLDYTMTMPIPGMDVLFSPFDSEAIQMVPMVRIWGATPSGQTACLHLHRVGAYETLWMDTCGSH